MVSFRIGFVKANTIVTLRSIRGPLGYPGSLPTHVKDRHRQEKMMQKRVSMPIRLETGV